MRAPARQRALVLAAAAAFLVASSCKPKPGAPDAGATAADSAPAPPPPASAVPAGQETPHDGTAAFIAHGEKPHQELRLSLEPGAKHRYQVDHSTAAIKLIPPNQRQRAAPTLRTVIETTVGAKSGDVTSVAWAVLGGDIVDADTLPEASQPGVRTSLAALIGSSGTWHLDSRCQVQDSTYEWPSTAPMHVPGAAGRLAALLAEQFVILPEEPVGIGGRWVVRKTVIEEGFKVKHETTYTLQSVSDGKALVAFTTVRSADRQEVVRPGQADTSAELMRLEGSAQGHAEIDLARPLPVERASDSTGEQDVAVIMGGVPQLTSLQTRHVTRLSATP